MILNGIMFFLSLTASFFLFFFNVPYWTGQDMADMSKSGIWRAPFRFLSRIGFGCFKLYKIVVKKISDACLSRLRGHREIEKDVWSGIEGLLDVSCSAGVLFLLISGYNCFMDGLFPAGVDILAEGNDGSLLGKLSEAVVFLRVAADLKAGDADGTILTAAVRTAIAMAQYVAINTLFFSILFRFCNLSRRFHSCMFITIKILSAIRCRLSFQQNKRIQVAGLPFILLPETGILFDISGI